MSKKSKRKDLYLGEEFKAPPGISPKRFEAYRLPSIIGGKRVYPKKKYE